MAERRYTHFDFSGAHYTIPPCTNAKEPSSVDWYLYKERHVVNAIR
ncbi:hypothetical protein [Kurthia gibsonii]|nr:hypothetical protein [Kurthia gibsonii]MEB7773219.1 hypothetical protein [Kurthia gibsonii]